MRTTLDIDDDVLAAGRALAARRRTSIGAVVSQLMRAGLRREGPATEINRNGVEVFRKRGLDAPLTLEVVNRLRDEMA